MSTVLNFADDVVSGVAVQSVENIPGALPPSVQEFRRRFRGSEIPAWYLGWFHFAFVSAAALGVIGYSIGHIKSPTGLQWLTVPLTFLFGNFVEYFGHKGPMHHPVKFLRLLYQRHTLQHHHYFTHEAMSCEDSRDFKIMLFPAFLLVFFIGMHAVPVGALLFYIAGANAGYFFTATAVGYYLTYEWLHFCYHLPPDSFGGRLPLVVRLRRHHQAHHNLALMQDWNFNITFPICDRLYGTVYKP